MESGHQGMAKGKLLLQRGMVLGKQRQLARSIVFSEGCEDIGLFREVNCDREKMGATSW